MLQVTVKQNDFEVIEARIYRTKKEIFSSTLKSLFFTKSTFSVEIDVSNTVIALSNSLGIVS